MVNTQQNVKLFRVYASCCEDLGKMEVKLHAFLTLALYGDEWSVSGSDPSAPVERTLGSHWVVRRVGHTAGLGVMAKRNPYGYM
jgi:hypothetical protein